MKKYIIIALLMLGTIAVSAQEKNKNLKVSVNVDGVCGLCENRIEKAALKTKGVKYASWSTDTHVLNLILDERKTDLKIVCQNIASAGHDNELIKATDEEYENLHHCCHYREINVEDDE